MAVNGSGMRSAIVPERSWLTFLVGVKMRFSYQLEESILDRSIGKLVLADYQRVDGCLFLTQRVGIYPIKVIAYRVLREPEFEIGQQRFYLVAAGTENQLSYED